MNFFCYLNITNIEIIKLMKNTDTPKGVTYYFPVCTNLSQWNKNLNNVHLNPLLFSQGSNTQPP